MVVRRGGKGGGDSEGRERQKGREPVAFEEAHNNRGHWRIWHFWSSWPSTFHPLVRFAQLCPPLLRRPPFDFTFYFDSIFLPVLFPYYLVLLVSGPRHSLSLSSPSCPVHASRVDFIFPSRTRSLRSLRRREAPLPSTLVLLFPVGLLAAPFSSAAPLSLVVLASSSKLNALSKSILSLDKIVLRFLIPPLALSLWRSRKKFEKSALLEIADQLFENSFRWPGRFNNH